MKYLKKIFANPAVSQLFGAKGWLFWIAVAVGIGLIVLLVLLIKRRRAKATEAPVSEPEEKLLHPSTLRTIWKSFLREIPKAFRRSIVMYEPFVVLGDSGVGKSCLIGTYTDWQGLARQFYPSYTTDPQLQIYLGSKVIVQEIPSALFNDTSEPARAALLRLWRSCFRKKEPTVVVVVNGAALNTDSPESLKKQAQTIRGKINILSGILKKPVKVCIALTHMDQCEGFFEFTNYLHRNNIPLNLRFDSETELHHIETCLDPYDDYLTHMLTTLPASDYTKVITFLRHAPELFSTVSVMIRILQSHDPLSPEPEIVQLSLTSRKIGDGIVSNPFVSAVPAKRDFRELHPLLKHQIAAAAVVIFGLTYLFSGYLSERYMLRIADQKLDEMQISPPALENYNKTVHTLFKFKVKLRKDPLLIFLPDFFPNFHGRINKRVLQTIRRSYLTPELERLATSEQELEVQERTLYLMALICASSSNPLGALILENLEDEEVEWTKNLDLPPQLIKDYIDNNNNPKEVAEDLYKLNLTGFKATGRSADPLPWLVYFRKVRKSYQMPWITRAQLQSLQSEAESALNLLNELKRYHIYSKLSQLLNSELKQLKPSININFVWLERRGSTINRESIRQFLTFLTSLNLDYPAVEDASLGKWMETIKGIMSLYVNESGSAALFPFNLAGESFEFNENDWKGLITRSIITLSLRDFTTKNKQSDGLLFFDIEDGFENIIMNPTNEGRFLFTGKGGVDGRFTRNAFERKVKPILLELPQLLESLPIETGEKSRFRNFVFKEVQAYANQYVNKWRAYYRQFDVRADSLGELRYALNQMQLPASPFQDFLQTIKDNTMLALEDNAYFQPFRSELSAFDFIRRVMQQRKDAIPELENYRAILAQMQEDLESDNIVVSENKDETANNLKKQLSPVGRIFLSIFREENSYLKMGEKWIKNAGISNPFKFLFLEPFHQAFLLGRSEVQAKINGLWKDLWQSEVQPILGTFPFDAQSEFVVTPGKLEAVLHPQTGLFWKDFRENLVPVLSEAGGIWEERACDMGSLELPKNMLETVNNAAEITKTLWDTKGIPQPLLVQVRSLLLPQVVKGEPIAKLSYVRCGKASAYGFNQKATWQKFTLEWWKEQPATVGLEFLTDSDTPNNFKAITVPKSAWSFYHLLKKSERVESNVYRWRITSPVSQSETYDVKFAIKTDPWALFQLIHPQKRF